MDHTKFNKLFEIRNFFSFCIVTLKQLHLNGTLYKSKKKLIDLATYCKHLIEVFINQDEIHQFLETNSPESEKLRNFIAEFSAMQSEVKLQKTFRNCKNEQESSEIVHKWLKRLYVLNQSLFYGQPSHSDAYFFRELERNWPLPSSKSGNSLRPLNIFHFIRKLDLQRSTPPPFPKSVESSIYEFSKTIPHLSDVSDDWFHKFIQNMPSVYNKFYRQQALQGTLFRPSHPVKKIEDLWDPSLEISTKMSKLRSHKNAGFFVRLLATRQALFSESLANYHRFFSSSSPTYQLFLETARKKFYSTASADILDNGFKLRVRSEIPLLLNENGEILTDVFCGPFVRQIVNVPTVSDCINIQIQRFRSRLHQFQQYTGTENRLRRLVDSYLSLIENLDTVDVFDAHIQDEEFQNAPGLFWTRFYQLTRKQPNHFIAFSLDKDSKLSDDHRIEIQEFTTNLLASLQANGVNLDAVERIVITEFEGCFFVPTAPQYSVFQARLPYIFPLAKQYNCKPFRSYWQNSTATIGTILGKSNALATYENFLKERFYQTTKFFVENYLTQYFTTIYSEKTPPIWCRLQTQKYVEDVQQSLVCGPPAPKSRFFTILNTTQFKSFENETKLMESLALYYFYAQASVNTANPRNYQLKLKSTLKNFVENNLTHLLKTGVSFRTSSRQIDQFLQNSGIQTSAFSMVSSSQNSLLEQRNLSEQTGPRGDDSDDPDQDDLNADLRL
jgi:hypothetical protein